MNIETRKELEKLIIPDKIYTIKRRREGSVNVSDEEAIRLGHLEIINCLGKDLSEPHRNLVLGQLYLDNKKI